MLINTVALIIFVSLLVIFTYFLKYFKYLREYKIKVGDEAKSVALISPCKGSNEQILSNAKKILSQNYSNYKVYFVVESKEDKGYIELHKLLKGFEHGKVLVAGMTKHRSQKIHNLLYGIHKSESDIIAFIDIDMIVPNENWLKSLVAPLSDKENFIATSFFRVHPKKKTLVQELISQMVYVFELNIATFRGWFFGGQFAIRRESFEKENIESYWDYAIAEDVSLVQFNRKNKNKIEYVPTIIADCNGTTTLKGFWTWMTRQFYGLRSWPSQFFVTLIGLTLNSLIILGTPITLIMSEKGSLIYQMSLVSLSVMIFISVMWFVIRLFPHKYGTQKKNNFYTFFVLLVVPFAALASWKAFLISKFEWADIIYKLTAYVKVKEVVTKNEREKLPDWSKWWRQGLLLAFPNLMNLYNKTRVAAVVRSLGLINPNGKSFLELGAGTGTLSKLVSKESRVDVTLLDNNEEAFRLFNKLSGKHGKYICCDAFEYKADRPYDIVFSDGLIEHFYEKERKEMIELHKKFVKDDGHVVIFVPKDSWFVRNVFYMRGGYELKYNFNQLEKEMREAGLEPIHREEDWHMIGVVCKKMESIQQ